MSATVVRRRQLHISYGWNLVWERFDRSGYRYECSPLGHVDVSRMAPEGYISYHDCLAGTDPDLIGPTLTTFSYRHLEQTQLACPCGTTFSHSPDEYGADACPSCGQLYNSAGQALRPMSEWEEPLDEEE